MISFRFKSARAGSKPIQELLKFARRLAELNLAFFI
jgi:hypothetical protein